MNEPPISRRIFLEHGAWLAGALWAGVFAARPRAAAAAAASQTPEVFTKPQWATVAAVTSRLLPSDDGPGAAEAGCVNFIDKALAREDVAAKPLYVSGIAALGRACRSAFDKPFEELDAKIQDEVLTKLQDGKFSAWPAGSVGQSEFFEAVRTHTIIGYLCDPRYGGNRDYVGWKRLGYPGGRHSLGGYTPQQMLGKEAVRPVWEAGKEKS